MNAPQRTAKVVSCPSCGGSIPLRALGQSVMVACSFCRTQLDVSRPDIQIIQKYKEEVAKLVLPLGARGSLEGQTWEVVGALGRSVSGYLWHEYLLFNPYVGFRWLVYDGGHWNFGEMLKDTSQIDIGEVLKYQGRAYRKFQEGRPRVVWVIGEFYWRVAIGDEVKSSDYVSPPYMLSLEKADGEFTWTRLEYLDPVEVGNAFGTAAHRLRSVAPNQPNPYSGSLRAAWPVFLVALLGAIALQALSMMRAHPGRMHLGTYTVAALKPEQQVFGPLTFTASRSLNELRAYAALENGWVELHCALVDEKTGQSREFTSAFSYYSGNDEDGPWTEGDRRDVSLITEVPAGTYNLVVEGEGGNENGKPAVVTLDLVHDVTPWRNFGLAMLAICAWPMLLLWRRGRFEAQRWAESDFGPSSDDDD